MHRMYKKSSPLDIVANGTVMTVKDFLGFYGKGRITKEAVLEKFSKLIQDDDIFLVHLTLFMHLQYPEIEEALELDDIYPFKPAHTGISDEFFIELIFKFNLHRPFVYAVAALHHKEFVKPLISAVIPKLCPALKEGQLSVDAVVQYLLVLADLSRGESPGEFFFGLFNDLVTEFDDGTKLPNIPAYYRISVLLRLIGVLLMKVEDYEGDSEISELNKDFFYTLSRKTAFNSMQVFQVGFNVAENFDEPPVGIKGLSVVSDLLSKNEYSDISDSKKEKWMSENRYSFMHWLDFVGGCGYLASSLLDKYQNEVSHDCFEKLVMSAKFWAQFKPKFTFGDFQNDIKNFQEFSELITVFGRRKRYQRDWFLAALKYTETFTTQNGLKLLSSLLVPNGDLEIALNLAQRALDLGVLQNEETGEALSTLILQFLNNPVVKEKRDELIPKVFQNGVHNNFMNKEFKVELGSVCVMMRTMNNERQSSARSQFEDNVFGVVFQNPLEALESIVTVSLRSQYFKPLHWCKTFLKVPLGEENKVDNIPFNSTEPIGKVVLFKLLDKLNEMDPLLDFIGNGLPMYIAEDLMTFVEADETIRKVAVSSVGMENVAKLVRVVDVYRRLILSQLELELPLEEKVVESIEDYLNSLVGFTYMFARPGFFGPVLNVREKCLELLKTIVVYKETKLGISSEPVSVTPELAEEHMEDKSDAEVGLLYIRFPEMRIHVEEYWKRTASLPASATGMARGQLGIDLAVQVNNSCRSEWDTLIHYWRKVVYPSRPVLHGRGIYKFVYGSVLIAFKDKGIRTASYLAFLGKFLNVLQTADDINFGVMYEEQYEAVKLLVALILKMYQTAPSTATPPPSADKRGLSQAQLQAKGHLVQRALLTILDLVEWIVQNVANYKVEVKERMLRALTVLPSSIQWPTGSGCFPIYSTILERLKGGKKAGGLVKKKPGEPNAEELLKKLRLGEAPYEDE